MHNKFSNHPIKLEAVKSGFRGHLNPYIANVLDKMSNNGERISERWLKVLQDSAEELAHFIFDNRAISTCSDSDLIDKSIRRHSKKD